MQGIFSIFKQVFFKKNCLRLADFLQSDAVYANIRHNRRTEYNHQKSEQSWRQQSWGVWGVLRPQHGFRRQGTLRKFLSSKEHLDWLKTDLNAAKITTVQDYKHIKKNYCKCKYSYTVLKLRVNQVIYESKI